MTATHLFRGNDKGEILDADGRVVGRIVPVEPTTAMLVDAVKERHGQATYKCVSASGCVTFETEARADYNAMLSAAPADWSSVAVRVPERETDLAYAHADSYETGWNAALDAILGAK